MSGTRTKRQALQTNEAPADAVDAGDVVSEPASECESELASESELELLSEDAEIGETSEAERLELRLRGDLESHGIVGGEAARIAELLSLRLVEDGPDGYDDLVAGARAVHEVRSDLAADLAKSHKELRQLERLMGGFATELRKLDEVLEVLAAYVRRMRGSATENGRQTLH